MWNTIFGKHANAIICLCVYTKCTVSTIFLAKLNCSCSAHVLSNRDIYIQQFNMRQTSSNIGTLHFDWTIFGGNFRWLDCSFVRPINQLQVIITAANDNNNNNKGNNWTQTRSSTKTTTSWQQLVSHKSWRCCTASS